MVKKEEQLAEEHAEYMKRMYYLIFIHGYKHGYEDGKKEQK